MIFENFNQKKRHFYDQHCPKTQKTIRTLNAYGVFCTGVLVFCAGHCWYSLAHFANHAFYVIGGRVLGEQFRKISFVVVKSPPIWQIYPKLARKTRHSTPCQIFCVDDDDHFVCDVILPLAQSFVGSDGYFNHLFLYDDLDGKIA